MKQFFMITVILLALLSCQNEPDIVLEQQDSSPVIAQVGGKVFHDADIDSEIMSLPQSMRYMMQDNAARAQILNVMIQREVVAQKAKEMGLHFDPLIAYRMRKAENEVLIQGMRNWQHTGVKPTADENIQKYYKEHISDFFISKQIHARHILLADKQAALELRKQLKAKPQSFATLAAQFSIDDSTKGRGGDLNWFSQGDMVEAFDKAVFALDEKNPLSQPIKTKFGWHIVQWLGERKSQTSSLEDVSVEIQGILEKQALNTWIESLLNEADVEILKEEYQTF
ncbi:MAG: peptidylprolyl isomerase [Ghiorsea sp.]|nr:peptidylprolyl isomerase [Ghiorsea sp.]